MWEGEGKLWTVAKMYNDHESERNVAEHFSRKHEFVRRRKEHEKKNYLLSLVFAFARYSVFAPEIVRLLGLL